MSEDEINEIEDDGQCSIDGCELDFFDFLEIKDEKKCVLHCQKVDFANGEEESILYRNFFEQLAEFIGKKVYKTGKLDDLIQYLKGNSEDASSAYKNHLIDSNIVFQNFFFPSLTYVNSNDYGLMLARLGAIQFQSCEFYSDGLILNSNKCSYINCHFYNKWRTYNAKLLNKSEEALYAQCTFYKDVHFIHPLQFTQYLIDIPLFKECSFMGNIKFQNVQFKATLFLSFDTNSKISNLKLENCNFEHRMIINNCDIEIFESKDNEFNDKFEFKNNNIEKFEIINSNHRDIFDAFGTEFIEFSVVKSIFDEFVGFEKCKFGVPNNVEGKHVAVFQYVTFQTFVNFRETVFYSGLDIDNINLKDSPSFLNAEVELTHTNRETFRIIKNSFDEVGNHLEANKFFAYEMGKYKEELDAKNCDEKLFSERNEESENDKQDKKKTKREKLIFLFNEEISDFGQNYFKPMRWIIWVGVIQLIIGYLFECNFLYKIHPPANELLNYTANIFNTFASNILPFKSLITENKGMEFISLIFYIIYSCLIWQTIVAVKRHTKR